MFGLNPDEGRFYLVEDAITSDEQWLEILYIISALLFSMAIFGFRSPASAPMGNFFAMFGMAVAIFGTLGSSMVYSYAYWIFIGCFVVLGILGASLALTVKMTAMPQMVGLLNAMGGLSAALESYALYVSPIQTGRQNWEMAMENDGDKIINGKRFQVYNSVFYCLGMIIGLICFTGSIVACLKLAEVKGFKKTLYIPKRNVVTSLLMIVIIALAAVGAGYGVGDMGVGLITFICSGVVACIYGVLFVMAIGGADMPVVISILNSLSGWSTVFAGLTFRNSIMIISGAFVGASGIILSFLMCKAMNRSLTNVLMGSIGGGKEQVASAHIDAHLADAEICARYLAGSKNIVIIPGYGMAVSRAQHTVAALADELNKSGRTCRFAIHPVAGRLPGHMNVLLAEANVPYDTFDELEKANEKFKDVDTAIVIGANDTVNPSAKFDKNSPIYGMPVIECWGAKRTIVIKRSLNQGYAGIDNPLFFSPNTSMLLGDGQAVVKDLLGAFSAKVGNLGPDQISPTTVDFIRQEDIRIDGRTKEKERLDEAGGGESSESEEEEINIMVQENASPVTLGVLKEGEGESRCCVIPKDISAMMSKPWNASFVVQSGAGVLCGHSDEAYAQAGATIASSAKDVITRSHIILKIAPPTEEELDAADYAIASSPKMTISMELNVAGQSQMVDVPGNLMKPMFVCCFGNPSGSKDIQAKCNEKKITFLSMDVMPRVTAAQAMDVLSSTAKIAGYRAVLEAVHSYGRLTSPEITAAGSYPPAKAMVVGCGVAGLQAIGDFHRMGADCRAFDVRKECADQVVSMGGRFLFLDFGEEAGAGAGGYANIMSDEFIEKEMALFLEQAKEVNLFVLTAAIPGRKAPILLKQYHVDAMQRGSVVVDIAAPTGGNCEATRPGENYITKNGVLMIGKVNFVSEVAAPIASEMLSANIVNWFGYNYARTFCLRHLDAREPIVRAIILNHGGHGSFPPPRPPAPPVPAQKVEEHSEGIDEIIDKTCANFSKRNPKVFNSSLAEWTITLVVVLICVLFCFTAPSQLVSNLMTLILASWTGFLLIMGVSGSLYTPLMSLTNAISGVVLLAGILGVAPGYSDNDVKQQACANWPNKIADADFFCLDRGFATVLLNALAIAAASMNVVGGFAVTHRMLGMFTAR